MLAGDPRSVPAPGRRRQPLLDVRAAGRRTDLVRVRVTVTVTVRVRVRVRVGVCWFFAQALIGEFEAAGRTPPQLGLVCAATGGSHIEEWMPPPSRCRYTARVTGEHFAALTLTLTLTPTLTLTLALALALTLALALALTLTKASTSPRASRPSCA